LYKAKPIEQELHTEAELIASLREGNDKAFARVYHKYYGPLLNSAFRKTNNAALAEDLVQDVFLQLYIKKDISSSIEGYLFTSLRNKIISSWRKSLSRNKHITALESRAEPVINDTGTSVELKEIKAALSDEVAKLPPNCRKVFVLSREYHLSNKEIAERLGISVNTVEQHMRKALRLLRTNLTDYALKGWLLLVLYEAFLNG
jgi:RNA polymerase sigma-70 factor (ECF subfamily)